MKDTEQEKLDTISENLEILEDFLQSGDFKHMTEVEKDNPEIKSFLDDIRTRIDTIRFFQETCNVTHPRVVEESHLLATIICDYLGYE